MTYSKLCSISPKITAFNNFSDTHSKSKSSLSVKNISNDLPDSSSQISKASINYFFQCLDELLSEKESDFLNKTSTDVTVSKESVIKPVAHFSVDDSKNLLEQSSNLDTSRKRTSLDEQHSGIKRSKDSAGEPRDCLELLSCSELPSLDWLDERLTGFKRNDIEILTELSADDVSMCFAAESMEKESTNQKQYITQFDEVNNTGSDLDKKWNVNLNYLKKYIEENKDANISPSYKIHENGKTINLGVWVNYQRRLYKNGKLSAIRIDRLNEVGFVWNVEEYLWNRSLNYLKKYIRYNNHARVPTRHTICENGKIINLGSWVKHQRILYRKGKLSASRIDRLNEVDFVWHFEGYVWDRNIHYLKKYIEVNNDSRVPINYKFVDNGKVINFGIWVSTLCSLYLSGKLSTNRVDTLKKLGFDSNVEEYVWNRNLNYLKKYIEVNNDPRVPLDNIMHENEEVFSAKDWLNTQRSLYLEGKLLPNRIDILKNLDLM